MKNLTVGIFHDDKIGRELGRRGTESDIVFFNRKKDESIFTFMHPLEDKIYAKIQVMSTIDVAIISFEKMTQEVGETVLMLDSLNISRGIIIVPPYTDPEKISAIIKGTSLESFTTCEGDPLKIYEVLESLDPGRDANGPVNVVIDHSFSVKGVGEVCLGFVMGGTLRKHDKLILSPPGMEVVVRSIQMQDKDFDEAEAGSRVGLAIKGARAEEMNRGYVISGPESVKSGTTLDLAFEENRFYTEGVREGAFHLSVGMQTVPARITGIDKDHLTIEAESPVVYAPDDIFILLDLNNKKLRLMGKGMIN